MRSASRESAAGKTLMATSRRRRESRARYTSPLPPAPKRETISYGPSLVPEARFISGRDYNSGVSHQLLAVRRSAGCAHKATWLSFFCHLMLAVPQFSGSSGIAFGAARVFGGFPTFPGGSGGTGATGATTSTVPLRIVTDPLSQLIASLDPFVPIDPLALDPLSRLSTLISSKSLSISPSRVRASTLIGVLGGMETCTSPLRLSI